VTALRSPFSPGFAPADARNMAAVLKAVADPSRLLILAILAADGPQAGTHLIPRLDLTQPTVVHHLRILRDAGLVTAYREGHYVLNALNRAALLDLAGLISLPRRRGSSWRVSQ
jgi:ArsR family transcriptional regulator